MSESMCRGSSLKESTYGSDACRDAACKRDSAIMILLLCCENEYFSYIRAKKVLSLRSISGAAGLECDGGCACSVGVPSDLVLVLFNRARW